MKRISKHKRILILMILSQLLLTGFVIQWLFSQYHDEKNGLAKDLNEFYINSHDEVLDTLLFKTYVVPALSENRVIMTGRRVNHQDSSKDHWKINKSKDSTFVTVNIVRGKDSSNTIHATATGKNLRKDILLKSVKLIVEHTGDSADLKNQEIMELSSGKDTARFKKYFDARVRDNGMHFRIRWDSTESNKKHIRKGNVLIVQPLPGFPLPHAEVEGFRGFLIGRIMTQIFFGSVLIFITGLAFTVSYRSLRNHMILNSIREEFISNITHELKTPVSTIMVALEALGNYNVKKEPAVTEEYINLASQETKRLSELINRVLDQSFLEQKYQPLNYSSIDVNHLINETIDAMKIKSGANCRIEYNALKDDLTINGDQLYIKGVLINLIDNGIKYCDKDPVIELSAIRKGKEVIVEIKDNGPGIPEEYQKRIFEKFFRLPSDNIHNVKGYGLGLSYARTVMELHGGSIEMRNLNPGSSFILKFPA